MSESTKFKVVQNKETKKIQLELWHKFAEKDDDWLCYEKFEDMTISELRELSEYLNFIIQKAITKNADKR